MSLATRCPVCSTVFRVVQDQLKVSEGWVRCGRCAKVFNAFEGLFDLERELAAMQSPQVSPAQRVLQDLAERNRNPKPRSDWSFDEFDPAAASALARAPGHRSNTQAPPSATPFGTPAGASRGSTAPAPPPPPVAAWPPPPPAPPPAPPLAPSAVATAAAPRPAAPPITTPPAERRPPAPAWPTIRPAATAGRPVGAPTPPSAAGGFAGRTPADAGPWSPIQPANPAAATTAPAARAFSAPPAAAPAMPDPVPFAITPAAASATATPAPPTPAPPRPAPSVPAPSVPAPSTPAPAMLAPPAPAPTAPAPARAVAPEAVDAGVGLRAEPTPLAPPDSGDSAGSYESLFRSTGELDAATAHPSGIDIVLEGQDDESSGDAMDSRYLSFVRQADRAARWRQPRVRAALAAAALLLALLLALQLAVGGRDVLASRWPASKPWLSALCAPLGCRVEPLRRIDRLAVESSGLTRMSEGSVYRLALVLRNRGDVPLLLPAVDLSLTDSSGALVARRVLAAAELGATQSTTIAAGQEMQLQTLLRSAERPLTGYTIEIFYP